MSDTPLKISERLRLAREQAGLSQGQVAKMMGYHRPTISEIEAGRRKVSSEEVTQFAGRYGVSVEWLVNEAPDRDPIVELAARELSQLKKEDLHRMMRLLRSLSKKKH